MTSATLRLAAWALAVSLVISRLGLIVHELGGHGLAAIVAGGRVGEVHLYVFGGGWIGYREAHWSAATSLAVSLAGIAVELTIAALLMTIAWRRRVDDLVATALVSAALGLAIHGGFYLAAGTADGFGDGAELHRVLGGARWWLVAPVALALVGLAVAGGRRIGGELRGGLPAGSRGRHAIVLASALAGAGLVHGALIVGELALRPSPTYQRVMATARDRAVDDDVARWQAEAARTGRAVSAEQAAGARRAIEAQHPGRRLGPWLAVVIALAAALGLFSARTRRPRRLTGREVGGAAAIATAAVILVVALDVAAAAWW